MLISEPRALVMTSIIELIAKVNGLSAKTEELVKGVYKICHFGSSDFLRGYEQFPALSIGPYGVCDEYSQILEQCPEIISSERKFVITVTPVLKSNQSAEGGWRWEKWGEYIGTKNPQCRYLYDEPEIDSVFAYHIYEKV